MNRGLLIKSLREAWIATMLFALALMGIEAMLAYVMPTFFDETGCPDRGGRWPGPRRADGLA